ncbi:hypothetical protein AcV7_004019 [Taiwanofungus camphoratus]|nr:hypothetical protein AcV7_004019 [Antrodia cinnamomea]
MDVYLRGQRNAFCACFAAVAWLPIDRAQGPVHPQCRLEQSATATAPHFDCIPLFAHVAELKLVDCQFQTFGDLRRLISGLPRLEDLTLVRLRVASGRHHGSHLQRPRLKTFWARGVTKQVLADLCSFLLATPSAQSITHFNVSDIDCREQDMSSPWTPLANLSDTLPSLQSLNVPVISGEPDRCILRRSSRLTELKFSPCLIDVSQWDTYWYTISRILSRITSNRISYLSFRLKPTHLIGERPSILPRVDWNTIDDVITNGHFSHVEDVRIEFGWYSDRAWYNNKLQKDELDCQLHHLAWHAQEVLKIQH